MGEDIEIVRDFLLEEIENRAPLAGDDDLHEYFSAPRETLAAFERIIADRRALAQGNAWRPIETAPKDGTVIDLWVAFPLDAQRWANAQWHYEGQHNCSGPANWCSADGWPLHAFKEKAVATHWQPLPSAPDEIARAQTQGEG